MQAESAGDVHAVSPKGAMGLMQIMPATWEELRARYGLGDDPFKPRDNILAGAAYLREMLDRFGKKGFLAAYNAGPARYEEYLAKGRPLPRETVDYLKKLTPMIDGIAPGQSTSPRPSNRRSAARSPIFAHAGSSRSVDPVHADRKSDAPADTLPTRTSSLDSSLPARDFVTDLTAIEPLPGDPSHDSGTSHRPPGNGLFVQRSSGFAP